MNVWRVDATFEKLFFINWKIRRRKLELEGETYQKGKETMSLIKREMKFVGKERVSKLLAFTYPTRGT